MHVLFRRLGGGLSDRRAGHTVRFTERTTAAPTSAPPHGSRRPVAICNARRPRAGTSLDLFYTRSNLHRQISDYSLRNSVECSLDYALLSRECVKR